MWVNHADWHGSVMGMCYVYRWITSWSNLKQCMMAIPNPWDWCDMLPTWMIDFHLNDHTGPTKREKDNHLQKWLLVGYVVVPRRVYINRLVSQKNWKYWSFEKRWVIFNKDVAILVGTVAGQGGRSNVYRHNWREYVAHVFLLFSVGWLGFWKVVSLCEKNCQKTCKWGIDRIGTAYEKNIQMKGDSTCKTIKTMVCALSSTSHL